MLEGKREEKKKENRAPRGQKREGEEKEDLLPA